MENNLTELNSVLFETLRDVRDNKVDHAKAKAITNVANSIIHNTKLQFDAFKYTKGKAYQEQFCGVPELPPGNYETDQKILKSGDDLYQCKLEYALSLGYNNLGEALAKKGKAEFENGFKNSPYNPI